MNMAPLILKIIVVLRSPTKFPCLGSWYKNRSENKVGCQVYISGKIISSKLKLKGKNFL